MNEYYQFIDSLVIPHQNARNAIERCALSSPQKPIAKESGGRCQSHHTEDLRKIDV